MIPVERLFEIIDKKIDSYREQDQPGWHVHERLSLVLKKKPIASTR